MSASRVRRALASPRSPQPQHYAGLSRAVELSDLVLPPSSSSTPERSFALARAPAPPAAGATGSAAVRLVLEGEVPSEPWPDAMRDAPPPLLSPASLGRSLGLRASLPSHSDHTHATAHHSSMPTTPASTFSSPERLAALRQTFEFMESALGVGGDDHPPASEGPSMMSRARLSVLASTHRPMRSPSPPLFSEDKDGSAASVVDQARRQHDIELAARQYEAEGAARLAAEARRSAARKLRERDQFEAGGFAEVMARSAEKRAEAEAIRSRALVLEQELASVMRELQVERAARDTQLAELRATFESELASRINAMEAAATANAEARVEEMLAVARDRPRESALSALDTLNPHDEEMLVQDVRRALLSFRARASLRRWCGKARVYRRMRLGFSAMRFLGTRRALNAWISQSRSGVRRLRCLRRAATSLTHRRSRLALNSWRHVAKLARAKLGRARRALGSLRQTGLRRGMNSWMSITRDAARASRCLHAAITEWGGGKRRAAWATWQDRVYERQLMMRATSGTMRAGERRAFSTWCEMAAPAAHRSRLLSRALSTLRAVGLRRSFNSLLHAVSMRTTMRRAALSIRQRGKRQSFNAWIEASGLAVLARRRLRVAMGEWKGSSMRAGWLTWCESSNERQRLQRVVKRVYATGLRRALNAWRDRIQGHLAQQRRATKAISGFRHAGLRLAMNTWLSSQAAVSQRLRCLRRAATSLTHRRSRLALNSWRHVAKLARAKLGRARRALGSLRQTGLRRGMNSWMSITRDAARASRCLHAAITEWGGGKRRAAWATWQDRVYERQLMMRATSGTMRAGERRAFSTWCEMAAPAAHRSRLLSRALSTLRAVGLRRSFNSLLHAVSMRTTMRRAALSIRQRGKRQSFNAWIEASGLAVLARRRLRVAMGEWKGSSMRAGWLTWCEFSGEQRRVLQLARRAFSVKLASHFLRWSQWIQSFRRAKMAGGALQHSHIRKALNAWLDAASASARQHRCLRRAAASISQRRSRLVFNTWLEYSADAKAYTTALRRATGSMQHTELRRAMNAWLEVVATTHWAGLRMRSAAVSWGDGRQRAALISWLSFLDQRRKMVRALGAAVRNDERRALMTWAAIAWATTDRLHLMTRAVSSLQYSDSRRAFNSWVLATAEWAAARRRLRVAASEWVGGRLRGSWLTWCDLASSSLRTLQLARRVLASGLHRALRTWVGQAGEGVVRRRRIRRAMGGLMHRDQRRAVNAWLDMVEGRRRIRGAMGGLMHRDQRRALNGWMIMAEERREWLSVAFRAVAALASGSLRRALTTWILRAEDCRLERRRSKFMYQSVVHKMLLRSTGGCFQLWCQLTRSAGRTRYQTTEEELRIARERVEMLETQTNELQAELKALSQKDGNFWRAAQIAENKELRSSLQDARRKCKDAEGKFAALEGKYKLLWRATHDVNYVQSVEQDAPRAWKVPANKDAVDRLASPSAPLLTIGPGRDANPERLMSPEPSPERRQSPGRSTSPSYTVSATPTGESGPPTPGSTAIVRLTSPLLAASRSTSPRIRMPKYITDNHPVVALSARSASAKAKMSNGGRTYTKPDDRLPTVQALPPPPMPSPMRQALRKAWESQWSEGETK